MYGSCWIVNRIEDECSRDENVDERGMIREKKMSNYYII